MPYCAVPPAPARQIGAPLRSPRQLLVGQRPCERVGGVVGVRLENFLVVSLGWGSVAGLLTRLTEQGQNQRVVLVSLLQFSDCGLVVCRVKRDIAGEIRIEPRLV